MQRIFISLAKNAAHHEAVYLHLFRSEGPLTAAFCYVMKATRWLSPAFVVT